MISATINHLKCIQNSSPVQHPKGFCALFVGNQRTFFKVSYLTHSFETFFAKWKIFPQRMENTGDKKTSLRSKTHVLMLEACCFSFFQGCGRHSWVVSKKHLGVLSTCGGLPEFTLSLEFPLRKNHLVFRWGHVVHHETSPKMLPILLYITTWPRPPKPPFLSTLMCHQKKTYRRKKVGKSVRWHLPFGFRQLLTGPHVLVFPVFSLVPGGVFVLGGVVKSMAAGFWCWKCQMGKGIKIIKIVNE